MVKKKTIEKLVEIISTYYDCPLSKVQIRKFVQSALSPKNGPGANRNWGILLNLIVIDDDVLPYAKKRIENDFFYIPIDILSNINRGLSRPEALVCNFSYCGRSGEPLLNPLEEFVSSNGTTWGKEHFAVTHNKSKKRNDLSGGVQAISPMWRKYSFPSTPTKHEYLRSEDTAPFILMRRYINFLLGVNSDKVDFYQPGGSIYHLPKNVTCPLHTGKTALNEELAVEILQTLLERILNDEILLKIPNSEIDISQSDNFIEAYGEKLKEFIDDGSFRKLLNEIVKEERVELIGFITSLHTFLTTYSLAKQRVFPNRNTQDAITSMKDALDFYGFSNLIRPDRTVFIDEKTTIKEINMSKAFQVLEEEAQIYAETLRIWPYLIRAMDEYQLAA